MSEIELLLRDEEIEAEIARGLSRRVLGEKFWYASDEAAESWLALVRSTAYTGYQRSGSTVAAAAPQIAARFAAEGRGEVVVVALGAGDAAKELELASAIARAGLPTSLLCVDVSVRLLDAALAESRRRGVPARALRADLDDPARRVAIADRVARARAAPGSRVLCALLGNTVGALGRAETLAVLAGWLGAGDRLLVDGERHDPTSTLPGYVNPDNLRFAWAPLRKLGLGEEDGELRLWMEQVGGGVHAVRKRFTFRRDRDVRSAGDVISFRSGETLEMSRSEKYETGVFTRLVTAESGLDVRSHEGERWTLVEASRPS